MRDTVTKKCPQTTTFEEKGEPKRYGTARSFRLPAYRLTARQKGALSESRKKLLFLNDQEVTVWLCEPVWPSGKAVGW